MIQPVNTIVSNIERAKSANEDDPLIVGFANGLTRALGKVLEPFFSESIWFGAVSDIMIRNGIKDNGSPVWNPDDSLMTKWTKSTQHVAYTLSPGSLPQIRRLTNAIMKKSQKGVNYEIPDELLGFVGFQVAGCGFKGFQISWVGGCGFAGFQVFQVSRFSRFAWF